MNAWVGVVGDRMEGNEAQDAIAPAIDHAAVALGIEPPEVRWFETDQMAVDGPEELAVAAAIWCAPGSPYRSLEGALAGIELARRRSIPFLGTCAGFQHAVIEFARNSLGRRHAGHAEYEDPGDDLVIDELLCSLVGQRLEIDLVGGGLRDLYGAETTIERYYCRFGLAPGVAQVLDDAGFRVAGVDHSDGEARILRLDDHPFFVATLFVPQTSSTPERAHPLVMRFLASVAP